MKKMLLIAVSSLFALNAYATKARTLAIGSTFHIPDYQDITSNPHRVHLANALIVETGLTASTTTRNNAEALVVYNLGDDKHMAVAFGKNDDLYMTQRTFINSIVGAGTYMVPQNPLHLFYGLKEGENLWSMGISYSNFNDKVASNKENAMGAILGWRRGTLQVFGSYAATNTVELGTGQKFDGNGHIRLSVRYAQDIMSYAGDVATWTAKSSTNGTDNESYGVQNIRARAVESIMKKDGNEVFWGAGLTSFAVDCKTQASAACSKKFTKFYLPLIVGFEVNANDWLVWRGALTQTAILDSTKDEIGLPAASGVTGATGAVTDFGNGVNTSTVATGVGLKFNNGLSIDGTLTTATTQIVNSNALMSQVGLTYLF